MGGSDDVFPLPHAELSYEVLRQPDKENSYPYDLEQYYTEKSQMHEFTEDELRIVR